MTETTPAVVLADDIAKVRSALVAWHEAQLPGPGVVESYGGADSPHWQRHLLDVEQAVIDATTWLLRDMAEIGITSPLTDQEVGEVGDASEVEGEPDEEEVRRRWDAVKATIPSSQVQDDKGETRTDA